MTDKLYSYSSPHHTRMFWYFDVRVLRQINGQTVSFPVRPAKRRRTEFVNGVRGTHPGKPRYWIARQRWRGLYAYNRGSI